MEGTKVEFLLENIKIAKNMLNARKWEIIICYMTELVMKKEYRLLKTNYSMMKCKDSTRKGCHMMLIKYISVLRLKSC